MEQPPEHSTPPVKVFSPEEISAIPPEIQKELNLIPDTGKVDNGLGEDLADIPPEVVAKLRAISGSMLSGEEPSGFSWAALVYGPFYYASMKDTPFAIWSTLASLLVYTIPLLIPLAFFARKRAWHRKTWQSEEEFWSVQKRWDRSAIIGGVLSLVILYFIAHYMYSVFSSTFGTTDPGQILQQFQGQYQ